MAFNASNANNAAEQKDIEDIKQLMWGPDIKHDVFRRWTQGFTFSEDEPTALIQFEGGPCSVIAPIQAFLLKNILFKSSTSSNPPENWRTISEEARDDLLVMSLTDLFQQAAQGTNYTIVYFQADEVEGNLGETSNGNDEDSTGSSPKKQCFSHEQFHSGLRCKECKTDGELHGHLRSMLSVLYEQYGVLLVLYSLVLTKGIEQLKNEVAEPNQPPLIDGTYGHGSQSLINLCLTGKAVSHVWDNLKDISGLMLQGISQQAQVGFLTQMEHFKLLEVGWNLKNPSYPLWILGSETHFTVLFSLDHSLVAAENPDARARRLFNNFDKGNGFITGDQLGDLLKSLNLESDPDYVKLMRENLDPEELGIITLNSFMETFFPPDPNTDTVQTFQLYHYNGLPRSCPEKKVMYQEGTASIMESPELQIITDSSPIKTCLMTKWPTIELKWNNGLYPSIN